MEITEILERGAMIDYIVEYEFSKKSPEDIKRDIRDKYGRSSDDYVKQIYGQYKAKENQVITNDEPVE